MKLANNTIEVDTVGGIYILSIGGKMRFVYDTNTGEMGMQVKLINKTGGNTVKGYLCCPDVNVDGAFQYCAINDPDPNWVVYEAGIADAAEAWVWCVNAICEVYCNDVAAGNPTRHHYIRSTATGDSVTTTGHATSEALPASPFATDKHFQEAGHVMKSRVGSGLTLCSFHTN